MPILQLRSLVQFSRGTSLVWDALTMAIPANTISFSLNDGVFKLGDGVTLYGALPALFTYADLVAAQGGVSDLFIEPVIADNGKIVVVALDEPTSTMKYSISDTSLSGLLTSISTLEGTNNTQDTAIAELLALALSIDVSISTAPDDNLVIINNSRYADSGSSITDIQNQITEASTYVPGSHLEDVVFYTTQDKVNAADKLGLFDNTTYYVDIVGFNNTAEIIYDLTSTNTNITITQIEGSFFSVALNGVSVDNRNDTPAILIASVNTTAGTSLVKKAVSINIPGIYIDDVIFYDSADKIITVDRMNLVDNTMYYADVVGFSNIGDIVYGLTTTNTDIIITSLGDSLFSVALTDVTVESMNDVYATLTATINSSGGISLVRKDVSINVLYNYVAPEVIPGVSILTTVYGGSGDDYFYGVTVDSSDNIICAGYTTSEGAGSDDALVVKFDPNLTILARKRYGGTGDDQFRGVAVDSSDNIICAGYTGSEGTGDYEALIVKFDPNLTIIARKRYGGSGYDYFNGVAYFYEVVVDSSDNIICVGYTDSEGAENYDALIVKFDLNLAILASKMYGGSDYERFYGVTVDSLDNIICVGYTGSEGAGGDALVVKFDPNLTILARKRYGGSGYDRFYGVAVDSDDNIICVGYTGSEGAGGDALVVKFDPNLTILARKRYGGNGDDYFRGVAVDSSDNIICVGNTTSEGAGGYDALVVKFNSSLTIIARKRYGGTGDDQFRGVAVDSADNIICVGNTGSEGAGNYDALIVKLPSTIPGGTFTGTILTELTMTDSNLTLGTSNLTLANSTLTLATLTNLPAYNSTLTLADSALTQESDTIVT